MVEIEQKILNICRERMGQKEYSKFKLPVFFHNLKNYDGHLIIQKCYLFGAKRINTIPLTPEKFLSFRINRQEYKDSFQFISESLDKLVKSLRESKYHFPNTRKCKYIKNDYDLDLLTQKGIYPYEYMDSWERFDETEFPEHKHFYSSLTESNISEEEYLRGLNVWKHFEIKTLGEYHDLYLTLDVLLLSDVMLKFRSTLLFHFGLDPAHFYTIPNYSWFAMLKATEIRLELITDIDMYDMIKNNIRGGLCTTGSIRYAKANNPYMNEEYDSNKETSYIAPFDANNLYGYAMCQPLPCGEYEWYNPEYISLEFINQYDFETCETGYILEVDLEYPKELHDEHNDYPLAPEVMCVKADMLSKYQTKLYEHIHGISPTDSTSPKLIANLYDKIKYVLHIANLQLYISMGLKLKAIHRVIKFKQSRWLKPFIEMCADLRGKSTDDFDKKLFKLMPNSVYGKTMENKEKHINFELVVDAKRASKIRSSPQFVNRKIYNENMVGYLKKHAIMKLDKPMILGFCILDISKIVMVNFHYKHIKSKYGKKATLIYSDTDSLIYLIITDDIYDDMVQDNDMFDFSDYPKDHKLYQMNIIGVDEHGKNIIRNCKTPGKFKEDNNSKVCKKMVVCRVKSYAEEFVSVIDDEGESHTDYKKTGKGVPKHIIDKKLHYDMYEESLLQQKVYKSDYNGILSVNHEIGTYSMSKISISAYEDKRCYKQDGINSYAYGHYNINSIM